MGLIDNVALWNKIGMPKKGSKAYELAGLSEIEGKINSVILDPNDKNRLFAKDKDNKLLFLFQYNDETRETRVFRPLDNGDTCTVIDKDGDGKFDSIFLYQKSTNTKIELNSTKDNDNYDEIYCNYNDEKDDLGYLVYHKSTEVPELTNQQAVQNEKTVSKAQFTNYKNAIAPFLETTGSLRKISVKNIMELQYLDNVKCKELSDLHDQISDECWAIYNELGGYEGFIANSTSYSQKIENVKQEFAKKFADLIALENKAIKEAKQKDK